MSYLRLLTMVCIGWSLNAHALEIPSDGTPVEITLQGASPGMVSVFTDVYVEVPENAEQLRIVLEATPGSDPDLLVRYGSDFDLTQWFQQAHYRSIGGDHFEHITITRASNPQLTAGRWYMLPFNSRPAPVTITLRAIASSDPVLDAPELVPLYDSEEQNEEIGFFDTAPFESPHSPATTTGEARRMAFERALEIISDELLAVGITSPVPITIGATFEDQGGFDDSDDNTMTLASARPYYVDWDFPGALRPNTIYAGPLVAKLAGTDMCRLYTNIECSTPDVLITFNAHEDAAWSYALESVASSRDLISIAMHEVMHGLGFLSLFAIEDDEDDEYQAGDWLIAGVPDVYSRRLAHVTGGGSTPLDQLDSAGRAAAATSVSGLRWTGNNLAASPGNPFTALDQYFRMYAPSTPRPGSSVSHVDTVSPVPASELMRPFSSVFSPRHIGHTGAFLLDMGWGSDALGSAGQPIHFGMAGLWYNQATSGQGLLLDVAATQDPPQLSAFWFTFADQAGGPSGQRWYTAQGDYATGDSSVDLTVYMTTGGAFDQRPPVPSTVAVGSMNIAFQSCEVATLVYDIRLDNNAAKRTQGVVPLTRVSPDLACTENAVVPEPPSAPITPPHPFRINHGLNGVWRERATSGQGLLFDVVEAQDPPQVVALWFTFAEQAGGPTAQRWFIAQGDFAEGDRSVTLDVRMSLGGEFDQRPPNPTLQTVGQAVLEFGTGMSACTEATLSYEVALDGVSQNVHSGEIALERVAPDIFCYSLFDR